MPAPLVPGDHALVAAPSGVLNRDELWRGLAWVRMRYSLRMSSTALLRDGFLAGSDARRRSELEEGMIGGTAKAIFAARGGYGASRITDDLPWAAFSRSPTWIVGFSDITALHAMAWQVGVASIHGPNVTGLGRGASPATRAAWLACLERPGHRRVWRGLRVLSAGPAARGPIVGGNLTVLHAMAAADRLRIPYGAVLALEDVAEPPYRIDRMLTSLRTAGHLGRVSAIVFGSFERCTDSERGAPVESVLEERTRSLGIRVVAGGPFGHGPANEAFVIGAPARVAGDEVELGGV